MMIGDEQKPLDTSVAPDHNFTRLTKYPHWLITGQKRPSSRHTFATYNYYSPVSPLRPSGLLSLPTLRLQ